MRQRGIGDDGALLTAYTSTAAHGCITKAMDIAGFGSDALRCIEVDRSHRIDVAALRARIALDRGAGLRPFLVVGSAGTVDIGAIDDLRALSSLCREEGLWFHVDGAYGALGILSPALAPRLAGIANADSIALDFHKWGQVPYDAGFLIVRDGDRHRETFSAPAAYLRRETRGLAAGSCWPCELGPDLSRGFRALKTWFTLKTYGTEKLGAVIARTCALAGYLEARILAEPRLELMAPVQLNIVCFRYRADDANQVNAISSWTYRNPGSRRRRPRCLTASSRYARRSSITALTPVISMRCWPPSSGSAAREPARRRLPRTPFCV